VKLALDPQMFYATHSVYELPDIVAGLGYDWMELSPKADFVPFFQHPRVDDAGVAKLKKVAADAGVGIASVLPVLRWSGPDEDQRQAAVRAWKRAIQITVDLGVEVMNSEFNGRPEAPELAESMFLKSMDELLPIFEREGLKLVLEPHPDDFIEDGHAALNLIRGLNEDWISFLYCTPHTFHQGNDATGIIADAADRVSYVHLADTLDHTANHGLRYIVNPPGSTVRVHQHAEIGRGEVDFDEVFAALAGVDFDGVVSSCVFGWDEQAREVSLRQRDKALALVAKHFGSDAEAALLRSKNQHSSKITSN
jgi:myo-inositol catabolism protein IolH